MRKYALVVFDGKDTIIDRYNLDTVTNPTGMGFQLNLSVISSDIDDVITKVAQVKNKITLVVNEYQNAYSKARTLTNWIQKNSRYEYRMALEYNDGINEVVYCEGRVTSLKKTEKDEFQMLPLTIEFTQTTPYFIKRENTINIEVSDTGKSYDYSYPYNYGTYNVENNEINNIYLLSIPLIVVIDGGISNPTVDLFDEENERYGRVKFDGVTLYKGEQLVINSAQKKIYKITESGTQEDYVSYVSPEFDTFLQVKTGKTTISINTNDSAEGFKLIGSWRQYTL